MGAMVKKSVSMQFISGHWFHEMFLVSTKYKEKIAKCRMCLWQMKEKTLIVMGKIKNKKEKKKTNKSSPKIFF